MSAGWYDAKAVCQRMKP